MKDKCGYIYFHDDNDYRGFYSAMKLKQILGRHEALYVWDLRFNADSFCQANMESDYELFDLDWVRKENCSAYQAWIFSGKVKEDCVLDMDLELCDRVKAMVIL